MILFGVDCLDEHLDLLMGRIALLTAPSGRTADNRSTIEKLQGCCSLQLLLAPEHGVRGDKPAGALFTDETDEESGLPVCSLYTENSKRLSRRVLDCFDTLVYDITDVGSRYYTFISTLRYCLEDCAAAGKRFVVLDRPNPLGSRVEGGLLRMENSSFVGIYDLPVCYGLTCGELALMMNEEQHIGCDLHVVRCKGLDGNMTFRDWGRPWIMPSLNMPRYETALLYPGTCMFEGTKDNVIPPGCLIDDFVHFLVLGILSRGHSTAPNVLRHVLRKGLYTGNQICRLGRTVVRTAAEKGFLRHRKGCTIVHAQCLTGHFSRSFPVLGLVA